MSHDDPRIEQISIAVIRHPLESEQIPLTEQDVAPGETTTHANGVTAFKFFLATIASIIAMTSAPHNVAQAQSLPVIGCYTDGSIFNTGFNGTSGKLTTGNDLGWEYARTTQYVPAAPDPSYRETAVQLPPAGLTWQPAVIVEQLAAGWASSPYNNATWISNAANGQHGIQPEDFYYRFKFILHDSVNPALMIAKMNFFADDVVYEVFVNGQRSSPWVNNARQPGEPPGTQHPYNFAGYTATNPAIGDLSGNWQTGENEIIVHIKSAGGYQGLLAQFQNEELCPPNITLKKIVKNDGGGTLTAADFWLEASGPTPLSGKTETADVTGKIVTAGSYTISETPSPASVGYTQTLVCERTTIRPDNTKTTTPISGATFSIAAKDSVTCTFTNDDLPTGLTLRKIVKNNKLGILGPESFTLRADGPASISGIHGSPQVTGAALTAGQYTLSEDPTDGYSAEGPFVCLDNNNANVPVTNNQVSLSLGQLLTCTVTNIDAAADLTLVKEVINNDGGTATPADFTLIATGLTEKRFTSAQTQLVPPGSYTLSEEGPVGYGASLFSCSINGGAPLSSNSITLADGDVATCTVVNNDIKVEKALTAESGKLLGVAEQGEILTYTVSLYNDGETPALYNLIDNLDPNLTYVPGSASGAVAGQEPVSARPLQWNGIVIPPLSTAVVSYEAKVAIPLPPGTASITNCIGGVCTEIAAQGTVSVNKKLIGESGGTQEDLAEPGEILTYEVTLINEGQAPAMFDLGDVPDQYSSYVAGSTRGTAGASEPAELLPLIWRDLLVDPGKPITVIYDVKVADALPPGTTSLRNIAYEPAVFEAKNPEKRSDGQPVYPGLDYCTTVPAACTEAETFNVSLTKIAHFPNAMRGMNLPFTIQLTNHASAPVRNLVVTDTMPTGFRFIAGSATIDGMPTTPSENGQQLQFTIPLLEPNSNASLDLQMAALPTLKPSEYTNRAGLKDSAGRDIGVALSPFEIVVETYFDCGEIVGTVFNDLNRNGYRDKGEGGISGARLSSANGIQITTDKNGRFHIACADLPDNRIGRNYILKLDPRSLPSGYRILSENPRVIRLTAGKMTPLDFATSITRVIKLEVSSFAFIPDSTSLAPSWKESIPTLMSTLEAEPSVLRIVYRDAGGNQGIAQKRLKELRTIVTQRWRELGNRYRLEVETVLITATASNAAQAEAIPMLELAIE